jgi:tRNA U34 2-thiouridine synthase MnmA/TrmU
MKKRFESAKRPESLDFIAGGDYSSIFEKDELTVFPHGNDKIRVIFKEPQMSVAPGQSVVFYTGNTAVDGGIIQHSL